MVINLFIVFVIFGAAVFLYFQAMQYGQGNLWLGLRRYFDLSYEKPEIEKTRILSATSDLFGHMTRVYGKGWKLTVTYPSSVDSEPCVVVERTVKTYVEPEIGYDMNETFWTGEEAADEWMTETLEDSFKILGDKQ